MKDELDVALAPMNDDALVEVGAKALLVIEDSWNDHDWEQLPKNVQALFRRNARAVLSEVRPAIEAAARENERAKVAAWLRAHEASGLYSEPFAAQFPRGCRKGDSQC